MIKRPVIRYLNTLLRTSYITTNKLPFCVFGNLKQILVALAEEVPNKQECARNFSSPLYPTSQPNGSYNF